MTIFEAIYAANLTTVTALLEAKPALVMSKDPDLQRTPLVRAEAYLKTLEGELLKAQDKKLAEEAKPTPDSKKVLNLENKIENRSTKIIALRAIIETVGVFTVVYETQRKEREAKLASALAAFTLFETTTAERKQATAEERTRLQENLSDLEHKHATALADVDLDTASKIRDNLESAAMKM